MLEIMSVDMEWSFWVFSMILSVFKVTSVDCVLNVHLEIMLKDVLVTKSWFFPGVILEGLRKNRKVRAGSVPDKF